MHDTSVQSGIKGIEVPQSTTCAILVPHMRMLRRAPHLDEDVDRCNDDSLAESVPFTLLKEFRTPGMSATPPCQALQRNKV